MRCSSCGHENPDRAKFCLACGGAFATRCPTCSAELPAGAKFCLECGAEIRGSGDSRSYAPKHLAEKILASRTTLAGERKQVTVLFADVKGSMDLAAQMDAEEWSSVMQRFFRILSDGVERFEGFVDKFTGDGIMALFGAPIAHEDHAQRACFASLHLQGELRRHAQELRRTRGFDFAVRIGLNSGEVVIGGIGDDLRMDYTALGHTVGLAQRMEQLAEAGKVYLTDATAALVRGYFALEDLGEFAVKGAGAPIRVYGLDGVGALRTRFDVSRSRGLTRFVGRSPEMAVLDAALERATAGHGQVVGVVAEPGAGKSRLCFEFTERCRARGIAVRAAHGVSHGKAIPFLPVLELLRDTFEIAERDPPQTARNKIAGAVLLLDRELESALPLLFDFLAVPDPERPSEALEPEERQRRLLGVLRRIIEARSRRQPGVLLIEDLHWIDDATDAFLEQIVEAVERTRTLLLVNFRPEYHARWMQRSSYQQVPLPPLGREAIGELLQDLLGSHPSLAELPERIVERTGGNPFFVEEVVQSLAESGALAGAKGAYRLEAPIATLAIPATVQPLLAARIDRLAEREKHVLQAASVIGTEFSQPVLQRVVEAHGVAPSALAEALRALVAAELVYEEALYPEAVFAFKHPLTQEVAYRSQLAERRAGLHGAVAQALEAKVDPNAPGERAALLAHHFDAAGEALPAARWHRRAAEWAGVADAERALHHWRRVRELVRGLSDSRERDELGTVAGQRMLWVGSRTGAPPDEMAGVFSEGAAHARRVGDEVALAELTSTYGLYRMYVTGNVRDVLGDLESACEVLDRAEDRSLRSLGHLNLGMGLLWSGRLGEAARVLERGIELDRPAPGLGREREPGRSGLFFVSYTTVLGQLGRLVDAEREVAAVEERARETSEGSAGAYALAVARASLANVKGDGTEALLQAARSIEMAVNPTAVALAWNLLGAAHLLAGAPDAAIEATERALALHARGVSRPLEGTARPQLAGALLARGDVGRAIEVAEAALAIALERGVVLGVTFTRVTLARALITRDGRAARAAAEEHLARADEIAAECGMAPAACAILEVRAELARVRGDEVAREHHLREAERRYTDMGATGHAERVARELDT